VLDTREIDSLLSPYLDAGGYRRRLIAAARADFDAAQRARSGAPTAGVVVVPADRDGGLAPRASANGAVRGELVDVHGEDVVHDGLAAQAEDALHAADAGHAGDAALATAVIAARAAVAPPTLRTWIEEVDEPVPDRVTTRLLDFSGAYGRDLMGEVARYALAVESLARRETFDVIHAHDWMAVPAGVAAKRASGKKLVVHVHACEHDRSGDRPDTRVQGIEQLGLDEADIVVCVSHYTANVLKRYYRVDESKLRVVHNALTQREQRERVRAEKVLDEPIVLFLGRITAQKGPEYFLEAAARVARVRPDVKFVIAGAGDRLGPTIELAASLGLARNTHFTGFLAGAEVERMYAMADVYVMPSVSEPFGIAPLEAMALDVPVIVSRQSGVSEVLRSALKVDYWDVQGIAEKILAVLAYPGLSQQLEEEGRAEARAMRWDVPALKLKDLYASLVGTA
jgi:glycosyltransferase involved in cell wall biosynthesis